MSNAIWCRPILGRESKLVSEATTINNEVWGAGLESLESDFQSRAEHGFLTGAFGPKGLLGTISGLELTRQGLLNPQGDLSHLATWEGATGQGTFTTAIPGGDTLCCVAVTSKAASKPAARAPRPLPEMREGQLAQWAALLLQGEDRADQLPDALMEVADKVMPAYLQSNLDPVLRFHARDKGPLPGAHVLAPLRNGRPSDVGSLGYNVLMQYPELTPEARAGLLAPNDYAPKAIGEALVLGAARVAASLTNVRFVVPYSRPAAFRRYLGQLLARKAGADIPTKRPEEETFLSLALPLV